MNPIMRITRSLHLTALEFPALRLALDSYLGDSSAGRGIAVQVPAEHVPTSLAMGVPMLLLVLPDDAEAELQAMAMQKFAVVNRDSPDLLFRRTLICLGTASVSIELDAWNTTDLPALRQHGLVDVGLAAGGSFVVSRHVIGEGLEDLLGTLQAQCACSGPNYNPYAIWSEEELELAASWTQESWSVHNERQHIECIPLVLQEV